MARPPVRLDPFQNIIAVSWGGGLIATVIFRHAKSDIPTSANSKKTHVQLIAPSRPNIVGWSTALDSERSDPPGAGSGLGVLAPTGNQLINNYIWYGGLAQNDLEGTLTDETYFVNLQKLIDDFSTAETTLTELRLQLALAKYAGVDDPVLLLCRGYESLVFTVPPPPFGPTFISPGPEIGTMAADDSVTVAEVAITEPPTVIGELIINLVDRTAAFSV